MKKILLVCNLGMSTSLLVLNMEKYCTANNIDALIEAVPISVAEKQMHEWDIIMLGPQVRHVEKNLKKLADGKVPVEIIDMRAYGMMNGEAVVLAALEALK